jgi:peptide/nickel transport system substrate-binding protein
MWLSRATAGGITLLALAVACAMPQDPGAPESGVAASSKPATPKRIGAAILGAPSSFIGAVAGGTGAAFGVAEIERLVAAGLTGTDGTQIVRPLLAEAVPTVENGLWQVFPDGRMETTWRIRPAARWHDGTPVTAEDLVFTARAMRDTALPLYPSGPAFGGLESVEAPDAHTVVARWRQPDIFAGELFNMPPIARHLLERAYLEDKASFLQLPYWSTEFVGTGPFKSKVFEGGSHVVLQAFDGYVLGRPRIDEVLVKFIPDPNTLMANVLAGEVDMSLGRGLAIDRVKHIADQWPDGVIATGLPTNWVAIYPQFIEPNPPIILDVRFRRALLHAIDRQEMADGLQAGLADVAHSYISPSEPQYRAIESAIVRYEYDTRQSTRLLEDLGYTRGPDGFLQDAANRRLSVELRAWPREINEKSMLSAADYWQRIGVGVETLVIPTQRTRDLQYVRTRPAFEATGNPKDLAALVRFHSKEVATSENNFRGVNWARYSDPEMDTLIDRFFVTIPAQERLQALAAVIRHMTSQLPAMGLFYDYSPTVSSKRLINVVSDNVPTNGSNGHEWDLR